MNEFRAKRLEHDNDYLQARLEEQERLVADKERTIIVLTDELERLMRRLSAEGCDSICPLVAERKQRLDAVR